jgi:ParB family chromosome partitioning protein
LERSEHVAEWVRLTEEKLAQVGPVSSKGGRGNEGGINAAARDLGVDRTQAQRAVKVDALTPEVKDAAREAGLDDNQSALLRVASAPSPAAQLAAIKQEADKAEARKRNVGAIRDEKERAEVEMVDVLKHPALMGGDSTVQHSTND